MEENVLRAIRLALVLTCTAPLANAASAPLQYTGVNISGGEFNDQSLPGEYARDYVYPEPATVAYFATKGMNIIRVPVRWERLQHQLEGSLDEQEVQRLDRGVTARVSSQTGVI